MKKNVFYYAFAVMLSAALFTSCSDDDELNEGGGDTVTDDATADIADNFVGEYKGILSVDVGGAAMPSTYQNVVVEKSGSDSINLTISNFTFMNTIEVGDVVLDYCELETEDDATYTCHREDEMTFANEIIGTCPVESDITLWDDSITVELNITWNTVNVNVIYKGKKLTGTESSEAYILSFDFDTSVEANAGVISSSIDNDNFTISVIVDSTAVVSGLIPTITVSDGATVSPASGEAVDFSSPVTYTVLSENGSVTNQYTATISGTQISYDFEDWTEDTSQSIESNLYPIATGWASNNEAIVMIKTYGVVGNIDYTGGWPVTYTEDAHSGSYAAKLEAVDTQGADINLWGVIQMTIPKVTAGTLFLGSFNSMNALSDPMATTSFGNLYSGKPLRVSGYYKYTPGDEFYDSDGNLQEGVVDKCSMAAVLYEVDSSSETLDGSNIYTSDKIVAKGYIESDETVTEYKEFNIDLDYYSDYDSSKMYKFAVIFSTSADGANYYAAVGSTLYIDDVAIINEY